MASGAASPRHTTGPGRRHFLRPRHGAGTAARRPQESTGPGGGGVGQSWSYGFTDTRLMMSVTSSLLTTSMPEITLPKTVYLPSRFWMDGDLSPSTM